MKSAASRNGNGNGVSHEAAARFQLSRTFTEISQTVVSSVVSTPCRLIDVLDLREENLFTLRETEFHGSSAGGVTVQHLRLRLHELERLHTVIGAILKERERAVADTAAEKRPVA
jgi:hypothetical protein